MNSMDLRSARKVVKEFGLEAVEVDRCHIRQAIQNAIGYADRRWAEWGENQAAASEVEKQMLSNLPGQHAIILFGTFTYVLPDGRVVGCPIQEVFAPRDDDGQPSGKFLTTIWQDFFYGEYDRQVARTLNDLGLYRDVDIIVLKGRRS